jgi:(2Fe-2S) ferredoxin
MTAAAEPSDITSSADNISLADIISLNKTLNEWKEYDQMEKPEHHIFVCASFRAGGDPKGVCHKKGSVDLLPYIENEILDRGLDAQVTSTGCMKVCDDGPVMVIHSQGVWYGNVDGEDAVDEILDALEDGEVAEDRVIS